MGRPIAAIVLLLGAALPVPASAHGGDIATHVSPIIFDLPAHQSHDYAIQYEGGDLRTDWVFLLNALAANGTGPIEILLIDLRGTAANWTLSPGAATQLLTGRIRSTGPHELVFRNVGPDNVRIGFFYDASCNCAGKPIPPQVPNAAVMFNVDAKAGNHMYSIFPEPELLRFNVTHATRVAPTSQWPQDFRIIETGRAYNQSGHRVHSFNWTSKAGERHYFLVQATFTDLEAFSKLDPETAMLAVYVEPSTHMVQGSSPDLTMAALMALAIAAAAVRPGRR